MTRVSALSALIAGECYQRRPPQPFRRPFVFEPNRQATAQFKWLGQKLSLSGHARFELEADRLGEAVTDGFTGNSSTVDERRTSVEGGVHSSALRDRGSLTSFRAHFDHAPATDRANPISGDCPYLLL